VEVTGRVKKLMWFDSLTALPKSSSTRSCDVVVYNGVGLKMNLGVPGVTNDVTTSNH